MSEEIVFKLTEPQWKQLEDAINGPIDPEITAKLRALFDKAEEYKIFGEDKDGS